MDAGLLIALLIGAALGFFAGRASAKDDDDDMSHGSGSIYDHEKPNRPESR